jgi:hypothetical protein
MAAGASCEPDRVLTAVSTFAYSRRLHRESAGQRNKASFGQSYVENRDYSSVAGTANAWATAR